MDGEFLTEFRQRGSDAGCGTLPVYLTVWSAMAEPATTLTLLGYIVRRGQVPRLDQRSPGLSSGPGLGKPADNIGWIYTWRHGTMPSLAGSEWLGSPPNLYVYVVLW